MTAASEWMTTTQTGNGLEIRLTGDWTIDNADRIDRSIAALSSAPTGNTVIDASPIDRMDTAGAWMVEKFAGGSRRPIWHRKLPGYSPIIRFSSID
jgi:phospholipid/cholesterol/gamma-HCH transport system permease protein